MCPGMFSEVVHDDGLPESPVVWKRRVIRPLASQFDSDLVIHSEPKLLLTAEVPLRRLDRHVAE